MTLTRQVTRRQCLMTSLGGSVLATSVGAIAAWHSSRHEAKRLDREQTLQEISRLLAENAKLVAALQQTESIASEDVILSTYLDRIRKDGVSRHSVAKRNIDQFVDNNTAIVTLTRRYLLTDADAAFRMAAEQYMDYAASWRDRWQSVFEIFMAGGNLPVANGRRPAAFDRAVQVERTVSRL